MLVRVISFTLLFSSILTFSGKAQTTNAVLRLKKQAGMIGEDSITDRKPFIKMLKLYKNIDGILHYWETWDKDKKTGVIHWGIVGKRGQSEEITSDLLKTFRTKIQKLIDQKSAEGYEEIEDIFTLLIEYSIDGMSSPQDVDKRHKLERRMNELLGWTGLGNCDGGSIGSGTMESCCLVVDFEIAKRVIEQDLKNTEFENYNRIFDENA